MPKLLIIADRENQPQIALERGLALAEALNADVEVVAFCYEYLQDLPDETRQHAKHLLLENKQAWFKSLLEEYQTDGLTVTSQVVWNKSIYDWVNHYCEQQDVYAVIKTTSGTGTFMYTSTDWHLIRNCPAPVLQVSENKWKKSRPVLAAIDLSTQKPEKQALNIKLLELSQALAKVLNVQLHVVHVITLPTILKDFDIIDVDEQTRLKIKSLVPYVEELAERFDIEIKHFHLKEGAPHKVIPSVASKIKADLLTIGTVGRQGISGRVIGNTAEKVLEHVRTDVLTIKA